ncbi:ImmA/IrrE family metallo-endopeptidase [Paenibacillus elgii]
MTYESLLIEAAHHGVDTYEMPMTSGNKGLYSDKVIWINKCMPTKVEKACVLAEELGHFHTSSSNILDLTDIRNRKQELRARQWAYYKLIPLSRIVDAHKAHVKGRYEIADYLGVTEEFLQAAIDRFRDRYGLCTIIDGRYIIYFEPLGVAEMFIDT